MMGTTHALGGAVVGAAVGAAFGDPLAGLAAGILGGLLPDIDTPGSIMGRKIPIIPTVLSAVFGHRSITHTLYFALLVGALFSALGPLLHLPAALLALAGGAGAVSHLALDSLTRSGITPLPPLPKHFAGPLVTGDVISESFVSLLLLALLFLVF